MGDLMQVPPREGRVVRATREAGAGAVSMIVAVLAVYLLAQVVLAAVIAGAAVLIIGGLIWTVFLRQRGTRRRSA